MKGTSRSCSIAWQLACLWTQHVHLQLNAADLTYLYVLMQAFQVSDQVVRLLRDGWFQPQEQPSGESKLRNPKVQCIGSQHGDRLHKRLNMCVKRSTPVKPQCLHCVPR